MSTFVHTVCETGELDKTDVQGKGSCGEIIKEIISTSGFNAGHSAFLWLNSKPDVRVFSFDLGQHSYTRPAALVLQKMFPGRLNVTFGDSTKTLPDFTKKHPDVACDIVVIDGGHFGDVPLQDFQNFKSMTKHKHLILLNDWPGTRSFSKSAGRMWNQMTSIKAAETIRQCTNAHSTRGLTIGMYARAFS